MTTLVNPYRFAAPAGETFFGVISMLREFYAGDPAGTYVDDQPLSDPGTAVGGAVDNGTIGADMFDTDSATYYRADGFTGGLPCFDQDGASALQTSTGSSSSEFTVFAVLELTQLSRDNTIFDAGNTAGGNYAFTAVTTGNEWRGKNHLGGINFQGGTADTDPHLVMVHFKTNDSTIYVDGTSVATDTSGTVSAAAGFTLGANYVTSAGFLKARVGYFGMYAGDLTADADYATWKAGIASHYGITIA